MQVDLVFTGLHSQLYSVSLYISFAYLFCLPNTSNPHTFILECMNLSRLDPRHFFYKELINISSISGLQYGKH